MAETVNQFPLIPIDHRDLPRVDGVETPTPSIDHSLVPCDLCGKQAWIEPTQLAKLTLDGGVKICYWCMILQTKLGLTKTMEHHVLNPRNDETPRRT